MTPARAKRATGAPVASGWSDAAFARVADVVHLVAGLVFPPNRQPAAEAGMRRAMAALRIAEPDGLAAAIQRPGEARDALLAELTIGETYFFREAGLLDLLRTDVLPGLRDACGPDRPLRVWSAGCASGEEPYTIAMLLRELGWPHPARILGTDVAEPRLEAARRGRYTKWSLRGVSPERIERWFERRGPQFVVRESAREGVRFAPINLIADDYPSAATGTLGQDVVLCRNVLIYFDMPSVAFIATRLLAALAPGGWLMLGASDPPLAGLVPCETMMTPSGVVYRRADRERPAGARAAASVREHAPAAPRAWHEPSPNGATREAPALVPARQAPARQAPARQAPARQAPARRAPTRQASAREAAAIVAPATDRGDAPVAAYAAADYERAATLARAAVERDPARVEDWVVLVRSLANRGQLREADDACVAALDAHRDSAELHYLHAVLLGEAGQHREAANAARRAVYLDRDFAMAYLQLGESLTRLGETGRASRSFENAARALDQVPAGVPPRAADGVPAARLRSAAESRLRELGDGGDGGGAEAGGP